MSGDDWMQQLKKRKQQETGQARQQQATTTGYAVTFTLSSEGTGMSLPGQETPEFRYRRFVELGRRGNELYKQGRLAEVLANFDAAIRLGTALDLSVAEYRNGLAMAYYNRGLAKAQASGHGPGSALADYDAAIALREALRAELEPAVRWEVGPRNDLGRVDVLS
ncbi:MAG: hypothetical protein P9F19_00260 [Candidatus Contendobacter sp.]|nr:hypothetical protein [Candidatus Contendobacter sp.]